MYKQSVHSSHPSPLPPITTPPTAISPAVHENELKTSAEAAVATVSEPELHVELEALYSLNSFFLHKDESRRRTVFEVRLIDGPLVLSAIDTNPCCSCVCTSNMSNTRFLFDSYGPVVQMQETAAGCCKHRSVEVCAPPYQYIGRVYNTSSWINFDLTVTGKAEEPLYYIRRDRSRHCCVGNNFKIVSHDLGLKIGSIYRRKDFGYRTGYTAYFPLDLPTKEKALLVTATLFLDDVLGEGDRGGIDFCCF